MTELAFRLGPLVFSLQGEGPVFEALRSELSTLPAEACRGDEPIQFRFVKSLKREKGVVKAGPWLLKEGYVQASRHGYDFSMRAQVEEGEGKGFLVEIAPHGSNHRGPLTKLYKKTWDWNYLTPAETTAKNIMYNLFDLVTAVVLLKKGASYLHASTCAGDDGEGLALIAWGGVGKTTSVMKLVTSGGWRFMSDDLGLLSREGELFRTPKKLQIYAYNVEGQPELFQELMEGRGPTDLLNWHWRLKRFGPKKVRRRISAEEFFGPEKTASKAGLKKAVFLERRKVDEFEVERISAEDLAKQSSAILVDELNTLFDLATAAESHGVDLGIGSAGELRSRAREIQEEAFQNVETLRLVIPMDSGPDELMEALEGRFFGDESGK